MWSSGARSFISTFRVIGCGEHSINLDRRTQLRDGSVIFKKCSFVLYEGRNVDGVAGSINRKMASLAAGNANLLFILFVQDRDVTAFAPHVDLMSPTYAG